MRVPQNDWPEDWDYSLLGSLCHIELGKTPPRSSPKYWNGQHTWVTIADMNERIVSSSKEQITDVAIADNHARLVKAGTLLMSFKLTIGKLAFAGKDLYTNEAIAALSIREEFSDVLLPEFLYWALQAVPLDSGAIHAVKGKTLNKKTMQTIPVPLPSLAEQRRIVARIEALLAEVREMQRLQEEIARDVGQLVDATLAEVFAPDEIAKWQHSDELGNLAEITARQVDPTLPEYRDMPHIYGASIEEGTGRLLAYNTAAEDGMTSGKYLFQAGDVLYSKIRPYLRKTTITDFDGLCSADMYPLELKSTDVLPEFLMWSLLSPAFTNYANNLSGRARIPKLNRTQLFGYSLPYPAKEFQSEICQRLKFTREESGAMLEINRTDGHYLDQLEQAILTQAFRGEF